MSLHERLAQLLEGAGALELALRARRLVPLSTISIVTFHRIAEPAAGDPFDPDVVDATPAQFRRHVETLARIGTPIGMDQLIAAIDGAALPANPVMITFDDGYRSCRQVALPILRQLGVPATFFIASEFASQRKLYWWEQIAVVLHEARGRTATLSYPSPLQVDASDPGARRRVTNIVKDTPGLDLERFLEGLRTQLGVSWNAEIEAALSQKLIMSWDDVRALADAGMDVESHTRGHRVLETLDDDQLRDELAGSRHDLEAQLGRPVRAISYPVGRVPSYRTRRAVADAGYQIGLTNVTGVNYVWPRLMRRRFPLDRFAIRRLSTERAQSDAMFLVQIAIPPLGFV
jgi:peptidoglycan/xylan/chitin deacetylase (PgdA/CDA1 family)